VLNNNLPDVVVGCVFDDVSDVVKRAACPIATIGAQGVSNDWVAISVKAQSLVSTQTGPWQSHVNRGRISLRCAQRTLQTFGILLRKDGLLIHLIIDCVSKEVATSYKVCSALYASVANNSNLCRTSWCSHQGN
jgi:hypothetical protein